jgi:protein-L-isoaspartate(D-aspartate) O-methyltransferase
MFGAFKAAMTDFSELRQRMVESQIAAHGVSDPHVLDAMGSVAREEFVPSELKHLAYQDGPLPIDCGQTISQPFIVAFMIEAAELEPGARALEIGTGSGYGAAVMSRIAGQVWTIERHEALAETARRRLAATGCHNVELRTGDGSLGWPEAAPFDAIIVTAGAQVVPDALREQLAIGGRLIIPVGESDAVQRLVRIRRKGEDTFDEEDLAPVRFVPLIPGRA